MSVGMIAAGLLLVGGGGTESAPAQAPSLASTAKIMAPEWIRTPTGIDLLRHYPKQARRDGVEGRATMRCGITAGGLLTACAVLEVTPPGAGFGEATLEMAKYFRMTKVSQDGRPSEGGVVMIPFRFTLPK